MVDSSAQRELAARFASHIDILQNYLADCGVPFGTQAETQAVVERLGASARFHDDMTSLMKSIIYSESETLTRMELLDVLCMATGGSAAKPSDQTVTLPVRELLVFVNEVLLSMQRPWFAETAETEVEMPAFGQAKRSLRPNAPVPGPVHELQGEAKRRQDRDTSSEVEVRDAEAEHTVSSARPFVSQRLKRGREVSTRSQSWSSRLKRIALRRTVLIPGAMLAGFLLGVVVDHRPAPFFGSFVAKDAGAQGEKAELPGKAIGAPSDSPQDVQPVRPLEVQDAVTPARVRHFTQPNGQPALDVPFDMATSHLLYFPRPDYPILAKLTKVQGEVAVQAVISPRGLVLDAQVLQGRALLRDAAEAAVRRWRFQPYLFDGKSVEVRTVVPVEFHLQP